MAESRSFPEKTAETIRRYRMLEDGDGVLVGVSGGADSVALLRVLAAIRPEARLGVAHVNHGWRGAASDGDERFVRELAAQAGCPIFVHRPARPSGSSGLEAAAREERWRFFREFRRREGFDRIAVAHNREDRAETLFLNLMRGSGTDGLAAMRPVAADVIRPLVEASPDEIEAYLRELGQPWRTDQTNRDMRFARNRVRHEIFPMLRKELNPGLTRTLGRTIDLLESEDRWMQGIVEEQLTSRVSHDGPDLVLEVGGLGEEPVALVRRILRSALRMAGSPMRDIGFDHLEQVRSLIREQKSGRMIELPGSIGVERSFNTLRFFPETDDCPDYQYRLPIPGRIEVPEIGNVFEARLVDRSALETDKPNGNRVFVDGESLGRYVKIRNWKNGDSYNPDGLSASKLKTLFRKGRIPRRRRRLWPVLVADSSIVWVASFPVSRDFVPTGRSRRVVEFEASGVSR